MFGAKSTLLLVTVVVVVVAAEVLVPMAIDRATA